MTGVQTCALPISALAAVALFAAAPGQQTFGAVQAAAHALAAAIENDNVRALRAILGPEGASIVDSGDPAQDRTVRARLARLSEEKVQVAQSAADRATILLGNAEQPYPVPLVFDGERWRFDSVAGAAAVLPRRIADNERTAIEVCRAYWQAQGDYRNAHGGGEYAAKLQDLSGESPNPGLFARAVGAMFLRGAKPAPYNGYNFRLLKPEGDRLPPLLGFPAAYAVSGIRTFIVDRDPVVYGQDLGADTAAFARKPARVTLGDNWKPVNLQ